MDWFDDPQLKCRHRGLRRSDGRFTCHHPQLAVPDGVDEATCRACRAAGVFFDRDPVQTTVEVQRSADRSLWSKPWNLLKSLRDFAADGFQTLSREDYQRRLEICTSCAHRVRNTCGLCGCYLALKARGRAFECPAGKWPEPGAPPPADPSAAGPATPLVTTEPVSLRSPSELALIDQNDSKLR